MKAISFTIISITALIALASAQQQPARLNLKPSIPSSITQVQTHHVDQSVIRMISHRLEGAPHASLVTIERFANPGMKLAEQRLITQLQVKGDVLDFSDCAQVDLESIEVRNSTLEMVVEFTPLRASEPRWIRCTMNLKGNQLGALNCSYIAKPMPKNEAPT